MSNDTIPATISRVLRDFSGQVAISVAASAVAAAIFAFPDMLSFRAGAPAPAGLSVEAAASDARLPAPQAGKFVQRHGEQVGGAGDATGHGLVLPATLMMPLSVAWIAPLPAEPEPIPVARLERPAPSAQVARAAAGTTRERGRLAIAQPLQIASVLQAAVPAAVQADADKPATILGVALPDSVTRAGRAIGGVAGTVGAAGSWTVSAASSLLPSWGSSAR
ncbi:hypothetical protein DWF00_03195 [Bosea caraganae]|uniref:Uncharacterized protein n=1 Tax=Bosea caraganae TaxID=2763117 RepID=A0A370L514_9HYPH|nr:hypothetical protein [Bosea caraganae]RDJ24111.1 hypothetical protein DWE98_14425 [Bosea caraganae]RDJ30153.1 hypothetical protein DWF00_03195 [Bosea caraganae]